MADQWTMEIKMISPSRCRLHGCNVASQDGGVQPSPQGVPGQKPLHLLYGWILVSKLEKSVQNDKLYKIKKTNNVK